MAEQIPRKIKDQEITSLTKWCLCLRRTCLSGVVMKGELGEEKITVGVSACARLVQRVTFMFGVASAQHEMTLVPFGNARNLSNQVLDRGRSVSARGTCCSFQESFLTPV